MRGQGGGSLTRRVSAKALAGTRSKISHPPYDSPSSRTTHSDSFSSLYVQSLFSRSQVGWFRLFLLQYGVVLGALGVSVAWYVGIFFLVRGL